MSASASLRFLAGTLEEETFFVIVVHWAAVTRDTLWAAITMGKVKTLNAKHFLLFQTGSLIAQPGL